MKVLFCILLLTGAAMAQRAKAVEPVYVSIESEALADTDDNKEFHQLFRAELNKRKDVALKSQGFDYAVYLAATRLYEKGRMVGCASAYLIIARDGGREHMRFDISTGPSLEDLARHVAAKMDTLFKQERK